MLESWKTNKQTKNCEERVILCIPCNNNNNKLVRYQPSKQRAAPSAPGKVHSLFQCQVSPSEVRLYRDEETLPANFSAACTRCSVSLSTQKRDKVVLELQYTKTKNNSPLRSVQLLNFTNNAISFHFSPFFLFFCLSRAKKWPWTCSHFKNVKWLCFNINSF